MATFYSAISWIGRSEIIYILSISFQLAAGLLLLIGNAKTSKKAIVSKFCTQHRVINVYPDGVMRDYEEFVEVARVVWINKIAFIYLVFGYLLSIFGDIPEKKWLAFGIIIGVSLVVIGISCKIAIKEIWDSQF